MQKRISRRSLLAGTALAPLAARAAGGSVKLGGPVFLKSTDPGELAREHRRLGYSAAYIPTVTLKETERVREIEKAFAAEKVVIAEVGAWKNMLDPDAAKRKENFEYVQERLALAEEVGALCCVDIAGSYNPKVWYGPHEKNLGQEFFDATVENCRKLLDTVKPKRTTFAVEMMGWSIPDSAASYLKLVKAVDRERFSVHIDVCNVINSPERFYNNTAVIEDCLRTLGRWVVSCHAKDLDWIPEMNVHFVEVVPGRGKVDYKAYLTELAKLPQRPPLMLEHLRTVEEYAEGAAYIKKVGAGIGIDVG